MKHFFLIFLINFSIITYCQTADEFRWKGIEKAQEKKYIAAIALFNEALKLEPNSSNIYTLRGDAKFELKDYEGAISDYSNALKLDGSKYLYLTRGNSKAKNKDYNGAIADYNKYIQIECVICGSIFGCDAVFEIAVVNASGINGVLFGGVTGISPVLLNDIPSSSSIF